jgi:hypothetical protein
MHGEYIVKGKIVVVYILVLGISDVRRKDNNCEINDSKNSKIQCDLYVILLPVFAQYCTSFAS